MPRKSRVKAATGIYHIMLRGVNHQKIFYNAYDKNKYLEILRKYKSQCNFELFAYCLMDNHVHLLIREQEESIADAMKKIAGNYAVWFNKKHDRTGHLFQDRYRSETVENERYFITVLKYILRNPVNAGICKDIKEYPFSSAKDYFDGTGITDIYYAFSIFGKNETLDYLSDGMNVCVKPIAGRISDKEASGIIEQIVGVPIEKIRELNDGKLAYYIPLLHNESLSDRQICRLTGLKMRKLRSIRNG